MMMMRGNGATTKKGSAFDHRLADEFGRKLWFRQAAGRQ